MKVFIDAGHNHSGVDTGAVGNGLREQDITYLIASRVEKTLLAKGISVKMSRNSLTDNVIVGGTISDSLRARYTSANSWGADIFVSIHCNAFTNTTAKGCEVYSYKTGGNSEMLAKNILNGILSNTDLMSRGTKTANYSVIKNTTMPAVLVETAFITNTDDAKVLGSEDGQKQISKGIAEGIMEYLGIDYSDTQSQIDNVIKKSKELTTPNDIVWELNNSHFPISDVGGFVNALTEAQQNNSPLYWGYYKLVNGIKENL